MRYPTALILRLLAPIWVSHVAMAAPCCGGGASFPSLISGDDRAQMSVASSVAKVIGDAPASGLPVFRDSSDNEITQTWNLRAATLLSDRWQTGFSMPLVQHGRGETNSGFGLGDVSATVGYEALPEWSYSRWVPKIFVYTQLTLPSGNSIYDSTSIVRTRGRGFYQAALGFAALKTYRRWDFSLQGNLAKSFRRHVGGAEPYTVDPTLGGLASMGIGYSPGGGDLRLGVNWGPLFEGPMRTHSLSGDSRSVAQIVWNTSVSVAYLFGEKWSADLSYQDQTLFGPAKNVALSRAVALNLLYRLER